VAAEFGPYTIDFAELSHGPGRACPETCPHEIVAFGGFLQHLAALTKFSTKHRANETAAVTPSIRSIGSSPGQPNKPYLLHRTENMTP
jgi:hypothetical protein